jgi:predicted DNA-binding transcriptional regulator AlpA
VKEIPISGIKEKPLRMKEVMEYSGYSRAHIYRLIYTKDFPIHKPTGGRLFFFESEVRDFLLRGRQAANYEIVDRADAILNGERNA